MHPMLMAMKKNSTQDWIWVAYLLAVFGAFGVLEGRALTREHDTLSRFVWRVTRAWPPFGWLVGGTVGFLGAHFFWPNEGISE